MRYRINAPKVIAETFDDEVIVVNFDDGSYYSLGETAREVWLGIEEQATAAEIAGLLAARFEVPDPAEPLRAVEAFLTRLAEEGLIVGLPGDGAAEGAPPGHPPSRVERRAFTPPEFVRYTDMHHLLLLDPVHSVDESGWPNPKSA
jgi:hypothetical protein